MNCPHCGNRTASTADRCLHCGARLANDSSGGFLDVDSNAPDSFWNGNMPVYLFGGVIAVIATGSMVLFGFDKYDGTCVHSASEAARYEASPEWTRDTSAERRKLRKRNERLDNGTRSRLRSDSNLRCYKKFTGHVDGVLG